MALLARDAPRSEHDPDLEAAAAVTIEMHPVTGAFADPTHESAFAAQFFRLAFPCHVFLMALTPAIVTRIALRAQFLWAMWSMSASAVLGLAGRVLVHRMHDPLLGKRIGSYCWTAIVVQVSVADAYLLHTASAVVCPAMLRVTVAIPLMYLMAAVINGSHGLGVLHKSALMGLLLAVHAAFTVMCGMAASVLYVTGASIVGFVLAHMAEMHLRHSYVEQQRQAEDRQRLERERRRLEQRMGEESRRLEERNEQLRAEKERLMYDVQRRGRPLDDGDDRSAIRRGLQAGPSQPYHRADSTDSSEIGAPAPADSPPSSLPPGPPSDSAGNASESGKSRRTGSTAPRAPPTWAELDAQFYAERAAESAAERVVPPGAPSSTAWAPFRQAPLLSTAAGLVSSLPPPSWAELAYRRHYAELAARSATEQGVPAGAPSSSAGKPKAPPPVTWAELYAQNPGRQIEPEPEAAPLEVPPRALPEASRQRHAESAGDAPTCSATAPLSVGQMNLMRSELPELAADLQLLTDMAEQHGQSAPPLGTHWQCPSSAPAPPQGAPSGSGQLGTPRRRPSHWAPNHCLGCSR